MRKENETIKEWLNRTSTQDSNWLKKAKHRQKYSYYYDLRFKIIVKYLSIKRKIKNELHISK